MIARTLAATLVLAAAGFAIAPRPAATAELNAAVEVSSAVVTVGDLFSDAGEHAGVAILYAPAPGQSHVLGANFLYRVARAYGIDWQPLSGLDRAIVQRATQTIHADMIAAAVDAALAEAVAAELPAGDWRATLDRGAMAVQLPAEVAAALAVTEIALDPATRRFNALLTAAAGTPYAVSVPLAGRLAAVADVPVLLRPLGAGDPIAATDIGWLQIDAEHVPASTILDPDRLIGQVADRALPAGRPLRAEEVAEPRLVERGALVAMVFETPAMRLTAEGQALEHGALGGIIRVVNTQSHRTVQAIVVGPNEVRVVAPTTLIAAATP